MAKAKKDKADREQGLYRREEGLSKLSAAERKAMEAYAADYMGFLGEAKTERLAYRASVALLEKNGFRPISGFKTLKPGDKVYRGYHGKTLLAAVIGSSPLGEGLNVVGGHTDAPRIDLKPVPLAEKGGFAYFDTHYYGGIKKYQWVVRPLALYGVVCRADGTTVEIAIGDKPGDPVFLITDILPHLGQEQAKKPLSKGIEGEDLDLLIGSEASADKDAKEKVKANVLALLKQTYGIEEEDFTSAELEIVPAGLPRELGFDRSMIAGYGHDDRVCAFAGLKALVDLGSVPARTAVAIMCDKEEIGSVGATGMDSTFFENSVAEIASRVLGRDYSDLAVRRILEASRMISADVTAAGDPLYAGSDAPGNTALMNAGACINKYTGSGGKGGASDARAEFLAQLRAIFAKHKVAWQIGELGKVDHGGGGTIAKFMARYGMDVVDMGTALLNMHAPWEIASKFDVYMTYRAYFAFFKG
ncbi:MAG: aminopeptidase [Kiritimatiellae bacterium]|nr:aminopeptidase [Kiritimatiellia bacterium]